MQADELPQAREAETAVVGRVLRSGERALSQLDGLRSRHLLDSRLRIILQVAMDMTKAGSPVDLMSVCQRLDDVGLTKAAGGKAFVSAIENDAGTIDSLAWESRRIRIAAAQRRVAEIGSAISTVHLTGHLEPEKALLRSQALANRASRIASYTTEPSRHTPTCLRADALLAVEFDSQRWAVSGEGRLLIPSMSIGALFGWGGVGKSLQAMELAVSMAAGIPYLGVFETEQVGALYVDFELPQARLQDRLRWLLTVMGINAADLPLYLWSAQGMVLGQERSLDLERTIRRIGAKAVFIDSITVAALWDELDPVAVTKVFRNCLYPIRDQGVALTLVDHARKPGDRGRGTGSSAHDLRGTTAKFNCLDWAVGLEYEKTDQVERVIFNCAKARYGPPWDPFSVRFEPIFPEGRRSVFEGDYVKTEVAAPKSTAIRTDVRNFFSKSQRISQPTLVESLEARGHKKRTVEQVLGEMVEAGDLEKVPDPADQRRNILSLPDTGDRE